MYRFYMQACTDLTNQHVLTLHAGMYEYSMLVGKVAPCRLVKLLHAGMYEYSMQAWSRSRLLLRRGLPVDRGGFGVYAG